MTNHGLVKVAAAIPALKVADCTFNASEIRILIDKAVAAGVQIICFPELSVTGYTCADLFQQQLLLQQAETVVAGLLETTSHLDIIFIIGAPVRCQGKLFNTALVCQSGKILGIVPKTFLPNYNEFYEKRWFTSASSIVDKCNKMCYCSQNVPFSDKILFRCLQDEQLHFGVEICEDLWAPIPPSSEMAVNGATLVFNLSASNELTGKNDYLKALICQQSARCIAGYIYASSGWGESTTDLVFAGNGIICENGNILAQSHRFSFDQQLIISEIDIERLLADRQRISSFESKVVPDRPMAGFSLPEVGSFGLSRKVESQPFVPAGELYYERCREIFSIQIGGLAKRIVHTGLRNTVIGISGGLDSTLALLVCAGTYDKLNIPRENIVGVTMPGYGTTGRTYNNALHLMKSLGVTIREIDITTACNQHFKDIGHNPAVHDVTFENTQARERTQILMDIANQVNGLVVGTGDMSELALGWATYNGDHMSMYAVNTSIPKTLVRHLVRWIAQTQMDEQSKATLADILDTPVSPELLPASDDGEIIQRTEDIVGPYELHDFFLYHMIRFGFAPRKILFLAEHAFAGLYDTKTIRQWMQVFYRRFFSQQFKRSCIPDGPKVGSINLSPRGDWRMPSDASVNLWLKDLE